MSAASSAETSSSSTALTAEECDHPEKKSKHDAMSEVRSWRKKHMTLNLQRFHSSGGDVGGSSGSGSSSSSSSSSTTSNSSSFVLMKKKSGGADQKKKKKEKEGSCLEASEVEDKKVLSSVDTGGLLNFVAAPKKHRRNDSLGHIKKKSINALRINREDQVASGLYAKTTIFGEDTIRAANNDDKKFLCGGDSSVSSPLRHMSPAFFQRDISHIAASSGVRQSCTNANGVNSSGFVICNTTAMTTGDCSNSLSSSTRDTPRSVKEDLLTLTSSSNSNVGGGGIGESECNTNNLTASSSGDEECEQRRQRRRSGGINTTPLSVSDTNKKGATPSSSASNFEKKKKNTSRGVVVGGGDNNNKELTRLQRTMLTTTYTDFVIKPLVSQDYGSELLDFLKNSIDYACPPSHGSNKKKKTKTNAGIRILPKKHHNCIPYLEDRPNSDRSHQMQHEMVEEDDGYNVIGAPSLSLPEFAEMLLERKRTNHYTLVAVSVDSKTGRKNFMAVGSVVLLTRMGLCAPNSHFGLKAVVDSVLVRRGLEDSPLPQKMIARLIEVAQMLPGTTSVMFCLPPKQSISHDIMATAANICTLGSYYTCEFE